ncbi:MAG: hypothetical protein WCI29_03785 [Actinomycetes bacterium]
MTKVAPSATSSIATTPHTRERGVRQMDQTEPTQPAQRPTGGRFVGLLAVRITRADVGARVSVRYRLALGEHPTATLTDVVGTLLEWQGDVLRIERRDSSVVEVAESALVAGKVVPAAQQRRGSAASQPARPEDAHPPESDP